MQKPQAGLPVERIAQSILVIRRQKVMIDADLAELYGVTTKRFNEQVRRNLERFPPDFHVPVDRVGAGNFKVAICDLKDRTGTASQAGATRWSRVPGPVSLSFL